jgi:hypothetical protein
MLIPPPFLPIASLLPLALALASSKEETGYGTISRRATPRSAELLDISGAGSTPASDTWWNSSLVSVAEPSVDQETVRTTVRAGNPIVRLTVRQVPPRRPPKTPEDCPPCFNCLLPAFSCSNAGECNPYDGQCRCPPGFGGQDCLTPGERPRRSDGIPFAWVLSASQPWRCLADSASVCGALTDGDERYPRPDGELCQCKDGWGGINCNGE